MSREKFGPRMGLGGQVGSTWGRVSPGLAVMAACGWVFVVGCGPDPRIGLADFVEIQRQYDEVEAQDEASAGSIDYAAVDRALGPYHIGSGDSLIVAVTGREIPFTPNFSVRVDRDGKIVLPLAGGLSIGGMEAEDVEDAIESALVPAYLTSASVHVEVASYETTQVMVVGAVQKPGLVELRRSEKNLLFAVVYAGGITMRASGMATLKRLRHPGEPALELNLTDPDQLRSALVIDPLEAGDVIEVEAQPNFVFVGGLVNAPGPQGYGPGVDVNILQALAGAGGLRTDVTPTEGTLIRRMPDGRDIQVKLDLNRLAQARDPNIQLAMGDILWVPHTIATRVQDFINRNFFLRAGATATVSYNVSGIEFMNRQDLQASGAGSGASGGRTLQDNFDPFGFLIRNQQLQNLQGQ